MEELQICSNNYTTIFSDFNFHHENLKRVYISNNNITDWQSICHLGCLFPRLETLIASDNPLKSFRSNDDVNICFPYLHTLSVDQVEISEWDDIVALTKLPCLHALRIYLAPLFKVYFISEKQKKIFFFSRMKKMNDFFYYLVI